MFAHICRRSLHLLPVARRTCNRIITPYQTPKISPLFRHSVRAYHDTPTDPNKKEIDPIKEKKKEELLSMIELFSTFEQSEKFSEVRAAPSFNTVHTALEQIAKEQGKSISKETEEDIKKSYSILQQFKHWDNKAKVPTVLFRTALYHALYLQDIEVSKEHLAELATAFEAIKDIQLSQPAEIALWKVYSRVSERGKAEGLSDMPLDKLRVALSTISSLQNSAKPIPGNFTEDSSSTTSSSSSHATTTSSASSTSSETPRMPWLAHVDVDSLGTPSKLSYFLGMYYRLALSRFSHVLDFRPSRLLGGACIAIQSFAASFNEGNMENLRSMLSAPLYRHFENLLSVYKEKGITYELSMKPIEEAFISEYQTMQCYNPKFHDHLVSLIPGEGHTLQEVQAMIIRRKLKDLGFAFWQEPDDGTIEDGYDPVEHATRAELMRAHIYLSITVYANCKEVYYLKDKEGKIIEGSESLTERGHIFTFFTTMKDPEWKIVDMNNFNAEIADEVPLYQIDPEEPYFVFKSHSKNTTGKI